MAFLNKLLGLVFFVLVVLYVLHLFFAGGFKDSALMVKDDFNVLRSCPSKPGVFMDFIFRDSKQSYVYWTDSKKSYETMTEAVRSGANWAGKDKNAIDLTKEGAFGEVCDNSPGVF